MPNIGPPGQSISLPAGDGLLPPAAGAATDLGCLQLLLLAYELVSIRRIHRSTLWAAPLVFASVALAVPLGMTPAWHAFAAWLNQTIAPHLAGCVRFACPALPEKNPLYARKEC